MLVMSRLPEEKAAFASWQGCVVHLGCLQATALQSPLRRPWLGPSAFTCSLVCEESLLWMDCGLSLPLFLEGDCLSLLFFSSLLHLLWGPQEETAQLCPDRFCLGTLASRLGQVFSLPMGEDLELLPVLPLLSEGYFSSAFWSRGCFLLRGDMMVISKFMCPGFSTCVLLMSASVIG